MSKESKARFSNVETFGRLEHCGLLTQILNLITGHLNMCKDRNLQRLGVFWATRTVLTWEYWLINIQEDEQSINYCFFLSNWCEQKRVIQKTREKS